MNEIYERNYQKAKTSFKRIRIASTATIPTLGYVIYNSVMVLQSVKPDFLSLSKPILALTVIFSTFALLLNTVMVFLTPEKKDFIPQFKIGDQVTYNPEEKQTDGMTRRRYSPSKEFSQVNLNIPKHRVIEIGEKHFLLIDANNNYTEVPFSQQQYIELQPADSTTLPPIAEKNEPVFSSLNRTNNEMV